MMEEETERGGGGWKRRRIYGEEIVTKDINLLSVRFILSILNYLLLIVLHVGSYLNSSEGLKFKNKNEISSYFWLRHQQTLSLYNLFKSPSFVNSVI